MNGQIGDIAVVLASLSIGAVTYYLCLLLWEQGQLKCVGRALEKPPQSTVS